MADNGFVKVYSSILASSVWGESLSTRVVWITMLAMSDQDGMVRASSDGIARYANVPVKSAEGALAVLEAPDPRSKSADFDGRRIERVDGGYLILNYLRYREFQTDKQKADAERQRRHRDRERDIRVTSQTNNGPSRPVATEAEAEAEVKTTTVGYSEDFESAWNVYPRRAGGNSKADAFKAYRARLREGVTPGDILAGIGRYAGFLRATGKEGSEYVKQASSFFGVGQHYAEPWTIPVDLPKTPDRAETMRKRGYV